MAEIFFKPICTNCGNELCGVIDYVYEESFVDPDPHMDKRGRVDPEYCPYCNEHFTCIKIPNSLPFVNRAHFYRKQLKELF